MQLTALSRGAQVVAVLAAPWLCAYEDLSTPDRRREQEDGAVNHRMGYFLRLHGTGDEAGVFAGFEVRHTVVTLALDPAALWPPGHPIGRGEGGAPARAHRHARTARGVTRLERPRSSGSCDGGFGLLGTMLAHSDHPDPFEAAKEGITLSADHLADGSIDASRPCDALTVVISFDSRRANASNREHVEDQPIDVVPPEPVVEVPCEGR